MIQMIKSVNINLLHLNLCIISHFMLFGVLFRDYQRLEANLPQ